MELIEVPGLGGRETQQLPRARLAEIIHMRVAEIVNLLAKEVQRARFSYPLHSGAVLSGGTALVQGLPGTGRRGLPDAHPDRLPHGGERPD